MHSPNTNRSHYFHKVLCSFSFSALDAPFGQDNPNCFRKEFVNVQFCNYQYVTEEQTQVAIGHLSNSCDI